MLFDTHFHLDLFEQPIKIMDTIEKNKIYTIAVTNLPKVFLHTKMMCDGRKYLRPALGYHPELIFKYPDQLALFKELLNETRYIGEIGLDNQRKSIQDFSIQKQIFEQIISICGSKRDKILTIHSRRAEKDVISMIGEKFPCKVILHWYSGSLKDLESAVDYGFYFSINSAMLQTNNGRNIIKHIPFDRLLLESDSPFLDVEKSSVRISEYSVIVEKMGILKNVSSAVMEDILTKNFETILSLP